MDDVSLNKVKVGYGACLCVHQFLPSSQANGPGWRAVIWVQGCTLDCPGCFNPETHAVDDGEWVAVDELFQRIVALGDAIEGISVSGGEPLQQAEPLHTLLRRLRDETTLSVVVFSGYAWGEIQQMDQARALLAYVDVLIAGRYDATRRVNDGLRSSANQTVHLLSDRYTMDDLQAVPDSEVIITADGQVLVSGIDPLEW
jgi:anaerobic ribonucleoside-triphosphate reductase activating protein